MPRDPRQIPVQFNVKIPFSLKEFIMDKAASDRTSQNQLAVDALMAAYGKEYEEYEAYLVRQQTRGAGATS